MRRPVRNGSCKLEHQCFSQSILVYYAIQRGLTVPEKSKYYIIDLFYNLYYNINSAKDKCFDMVSEHSNCITQYNLSISFYTKHNLDRVFIKSRHFTCFLFHALVASNSKLVILSKGWVWMYMHIGMKAQFQN